MNLKVGDWVELSDSMLVGFPQSTLNRWLPHLPAKIKEISSVGSSALVRVDSCFNSDNSGLFWFYRCELKSAAPPEEIIP